MTDGLRQPAASAELSELHLRLERLAAHVPGVLYTYHLRPDGSSCFPYSSAGMRDVYGVTPEEVREDATPVFKVLHPDDLERVSARITESARTLTRWRDEYRVCLPGNRVLWMEGEATPSALPDGGILWHGYIRDITARKVAEAEREEQRRIEALVSDLAARFVRVSPEPAAVGAEVGEALRRIGEATGMDVCAAWEAPTDRPDTVVLLYMHRRDGGPVPPQGMDGAAAFPWALARLHARRGTVVLGDTTALPAEATTDLAGYAALAVGSAIHVPFFAADGSLVGVFAAGTGRAGTPSAETVARIELFAHLVFDLLVRTRSDRALAASLEERERLQEQIVQAQKMEAVGRLAGGVAHDFNNMLGAIIGYAELALEQVPPGATLRADLEEILKAANRSKGITRQLLAFARKAMVTPQLIDLNRAVDGMLTMLRRLIGENITLEWVPGEIGWPVRIDPAQVDQVLANLCVNARDAIDDTGTVTVSTGRVTITEADQARHPGAAPGEYATLSVRDTGRGIPPEALGHLFEPFFTTKPVGQGTGLGLPTVYGIVTQNRGFVTVDSAPGRGSTFHVHFPRHHGAVAAEPAEEAGGLVPGHGETVLVVEDEPAILSMVTRTLEGCGYRMLAAADPDTALTIARTHPTPIDLLLSDVVMPGMNGRTLALAVRSLRPDIACLFMSGYAADVVLADQDGVPTCAYVQKPFTRQDLTAKVREVLDADAVPLPPTGAP
jgi:signal transduction histidine kinase/ActR/RegA family two-component response regulator